jgi:hypothetical protein
MSNIEFACCIIYINTIKFFPSREATSPIRPDFRCFEMEKTVLNCPHSLKRDHLYIVEGWPYKRGTTVDIQ